MLPYNFNAVISIDEPIIIGKPESDGRGVEAAGKTQPVAGNGCGAGKVELDRIVEFVSVDTVNLRNVVVAVRRSPVENPLKYFYRGETEFWWENGVEYALTEGPDAHERR